MPKTKKNKEERAAEMSRMVAEAVRAEFERQRTLRKRKRAPSEQSEDLNVSDSDGESYHLGYRQWILLWYL